MTSDAFLEIYRQFEDALDDKYAGKKRKYSSVVIEYLNDEESKSFRDRIDVCREIRNVLSHNAKINGKDIVSPADEMGDFLKTVTELIKKPPLAIDFGTKGENIFYAGINQTAIKIMGIMNKKGYSHVPILQNGKFIGVFSQGAVFRHVLYNYQLPIKKTTTIAQMRDFLPIHAHSENYEFCAEDLTVFEARKKFETVKDKNKRISVIFITETGSMDEELLCMITPWDIIGHGVQIGS